MSTEVNKEEEIEEVVEQSEDAMWNKSDEELEEEYNKLKDDSNNEQIVEANDSDLNAINKELGDDEEVEPEKLEQPEQDSNEPSEEKDFENTPSSKFKPLKANGKDIPIEDIEELYTLASKGINYTQKMQNIKPFRSAIELMQEQQLTLDDLNLLSDIKQGNKDAVKKLIKDVDLDIYEEFDPAEEVNYIPNNYAPDPKVVEVNDIVSNLAQDEEFKVTEKVISTMLDDTSRQEFLDKPNLIEALHNDIKSGIFYDIEPEMTKMKLLGSGNESFLELYSKAADKVSQKLKTQTVQKTEDKIQTQRNNGISKKRASVGVTKKQQPKQDMSNYQVNYADMSDDEYESLYNL